MSISSASSERTERYRYIISSRSANTEGTCIRRSASMRSAKGVTATRIMTAATQSIVLQKIIAKESIPRLIRTPATSPAVPRSNMRQLTPAKKAKGSAGSTRFSSRPAGTEARTHISTG